MKNAITWLLPRLPLPMLALAASYGVYKFNLLFVPNWVSLIAAAAFEITYVGIAMADIPPERRRNAHAIAVAAVTVSIIYNTLAGLFELRPALLDARPLWADVSLAVLHGAPLAIVAYAVAALLLHRLPDETPQSVTTITDRQAAILRLRLDGIKITRDIAQEYGYSSPQAANADTAPLYHALRIQEEPFRLDQVMQ